MPRIGFVFLLLLVASCKYKSEEKPTVIRSKVELNDSCYSEMFRARKDASAGLLKYYVYGIAYPSKDIIARYKKKNIEVVSWGCVLSNNLLCYNKIADSVVSAANN